MTIPLTNALGVTSGKHHTITRAKYTFLVRQCGEGKIERDVREEREGMGSSVPLSTMSYSCRLS
jgi:hypothetical protein